MSQSGKHVSHWGENYNWNREYQTYPESFFEVFDHVFMVRVVIVLAVIHRLEKIVVS